MYDSPNYPSEPEAAEAFVAGHPAGLLIATPPGGHPQATMLPFRKEGDRIELHGVRADPTILAAAANPRVSFVVADFLAFTPHDWVDPVNAARATLNFRLVVYEGTATLSTDPSEVAGVLRRLLEAYEPGATYEPVVDGAFYGPRLQRLAAVWIDIQRTREKFKVGPYGPDELKRSVAARLRDRGLPADPRAAEVIESYLPPDD
ncbi:MAG: FMN-binding negative transcriptional regulator [Actinomycetota bacterium]